MCSVGRHAEIVRSAEMVYASQGVGSVRSVQMENVVIIAMIGTPAQLIAAWEGYVICPQFLDRHNCVFSG